MLRVCAALLAASLLAAPAHALVGASTEAGAREAAQTVMVLKRAARSAAFCTGVVLAPDVVLTAGHCADGAQALAINAAPPGAQPRLVGVRETRLHPEFRRNAAKTRQRSIDLALLRLAEPLPA
ncbi:MAG TPA: trypsin-like serine protease, partial [Beijerinckiaceae bacterium]